MSTLLPEAAKAALDEAKSLVSKFLGPGAEEVGALIGDHLRTFRLKRQIGLLRKTEQILKSEGIAPKAVNLKVLLPLLENAALEEDNEMSDRWASLLASAANPNNKELLEVSFIEILKQLPPKHAFVLSVFYEQIDRHKILPVQWSEKGIVAQYLEDMMEMEPTQFSLVIDNLLRLRLIDYPSVLLDTVNGNAVRFQVTSANILCATHLGRSFVTACSKCPREGTYYSVPSDSVSNVYNTKGGPLPIAKSPPVWL